MTIRNVQRAWYAIRWKMPIIFAFVSIISMILVAYLMVAVLNVVIRRESAYLISTAGGMLTLVYFSEVG